MKKALIIDGNSLMFRAYYGTINQLDFFVKNNIFPTNAIKTMMLIIFKILETNKYDYAVIAFDHKEKNFRKQQFEEYKANRAKTPEHLIAQIPIIQEIMPFFGFNVYCVPGIEADDIVGSSSKILSDNDVYCDIYTSDKDMLQLVNKHVNVIHFKKGISETITYTEDNFENLNDGLKPYQIPDYKGIAGDSSDNLPGIKGIGHKTAIDLLKQFKTLETIIDNLDFISSKSVKSKISENRDIGLKCKELATILTDYFDEKNIDELKIKNMNEEEIKKIIEKYKFSGFNKYIN